LRIRIVAAVALVALALTLSGQRVAAQVHESSNIALPVGYRSWQLISVAALGPPFSDIRAKLGNEIALEDFRRGTIPYRDGAIIVRLAWKQSRDSQTNSALGREPQLQGLSPDTIAKDLSQSFEAGAPTNVQLMVKDSKRYAATGGWGFAQFTNGKRDVVITSPRDPRSCFACHVPAKATDFVFTRYAP
jgi:Cytochrome P460